MAQAKTKWQNLRDTFRKELTKKSKKVTGSAASNISNKPWKYSNQLSFLNDIFASRHMISSLPSTSTSNFESSESIVAEINLLNNSDSVEECEAINQDPVQLQPALKPKLQGKRKFDKADAISQLIAIEKKKLDEIEKFNCKQELKTDDNYHFLMSLLPYFNYMSKKVNMATRMQMQKIIFDTIDTADSD